jgi:hypothetical protein
MEKATINVPFEMVKTTMNIFKVDFDAAYDIIVKGIVNNTREDLKIEFEKYMKGQPND